jgi:hypothetical protein
MNDRFKDPIQFEEVSPLTKPSENHPLNYLQYYHLEKYLFEDVREHFFRDGKLDAFDLFSIIIWKANRAKSKLAKRLKENHESLESAVEQFTRALFAAPTAEARLIVAMKDWGFYLPMASAILAVLWPEEFTIYDVRVCEQLRDFHTLANMKAEQVWPNYVKYREAVSRAAPTQQTLRDKDRFLWGKSAAKQLRKNIEEEFAHSSDED